MELKLLFFHGKDIMMINEDFYCNKSKVFVDGSHRCAQVSINFAFLFDLTDLWVICTDIRRFLSGKERIHSNQK